MRILSVVTKLMVEARCSVVSAARGLPQSRISPAAVPSPAIARSRVLLPVPLAAYERRDRPLREHGVGVAQQDAAAVGEGEAVQRDARCPGCGAGVRSGGMEDVGCHFRRGCGCGRRR